MGSTPSPEHPPPPKGVGYGLWLTGLPRCHDNCSIPAWQGWEISSIPSPPRPDMALDLGQAASQTQAGAQGAIPAGSEGWAMLLLTQPFLHSPPRATELPGHGQERFLLFRCGSSYSKPFHLLWICGVQASRASSRLPPNPPVFSGGDEVGSGLPDHGPCSHSCPRFGGSRARGVSGLVLPQLIGAPSRAALALCSLPTLQL